MGRPPLFRPVPLAPNEWRALHELLSLGAWTVDEAWDAAPDLDTLYARGLLLTLPTELGPLVTLSRKGRAALGQGERAGPSFSRLVDRTYLRLCLEDHGWQVLREARAENGRALERFPVVRTPLGEVYAAGKLTGGGYSAMGVRGLMERVHGALLTRRERLLVFTPRTSRGQKAAAEYASTLWLFPHRPTFGKEDVGRLGTAREFGEAWEAAPDEGPILTPAMAERWRARGVPDLTLEVLQLTRAGRVERAREALATDGVLAEPQLARHYHLDARDLPDVPFVEDVVRPIHGRASLEVGARFFVASRRMKHIEGPRLSHAAGVTELRHALGIAPSAWKVEARSELGLRLEEPDAVARVNAEPGNAGRVAVEYDSGMYTRTVAWRKARTFADRGFARIVWGVGSDLRAARLRAWMRADVRVVRWWDGDAEGEV